PSLPNLKAAGCWKADVSNQRVIVRSDRFGLPATCARRLPDENELVVLVWVVMVKGAPVWITASVPSAQPPTRCRTGLFARKRRPVPNGSSYTELSVKRRLISFSDGPQSARRL